MTKGNKIDAFLNKVFYHWRAKHYFGECGKNSYCVKPIRIINGRAVKIGCNVSILNGARIETYRQDNNESEPIIDIGDGCNIEQSVHITGGKKVFIGKQSSLLFGVVVTDINHPYSDITTPASKQKIVCNPVEIGEQCFIGAHSVILPGVVLGKHVIVGANSVVTHSFPDYCVIAGSPAQIIKRYDLNLKDWVKI